MPTVNGEVDYAKNGFNPTDILTDFDYGEVSTLPNGQALHEYTVVAQEKTIEIVSVWSSPPGHTTDGCRGRRFGFVKATG